MCGGGYRVRTRFVEQGTCLELSSDIETCNTELCEGIEQLSTFEILTLPNIPLDLIKILMPMVRYAIKMKTLNGLIVA